MQLDDAPPNEFSDMPGVLAYTITDDYFETKRRFFFKTSYLFRN